MLNPDAQLSLMISNICGTDRLTDGQIVGQGVDDSTVKLGGLSVPLCGIVCQGNATVMCINVSVNHFNQWWFCFQITKDGEDDGATAIGAEGGDEENEEEPQSPDVEAAAEVAAHVLDNVVISPQDYEDLRKR